MHMRIRATMQVCMQTWQQPHQGAHDSGQVATAPPERGDQREAAGNKRNECGTAENGYLPHPPSNLTPCEMVTGGGPIGASGVAVRESLDTQKKK